MAEIVVIEDAFPKELCELITSFMCKHEELQRAVGYQDMGNNVICDTICLDQHKQNAAAREIDAAIASKIGQCINIALTTMCRDQSWTMALPFTGSIHDTGYELRRVKGATRMHNDDLDIKFSGNTVHYRLASVCVCLSETGDEIVFPVQNRTVAYRPGMLVLFPTCWMYPHYTTFGEMPSFRLQTWLSTTRTR